MPSRLLTSIVLRSVMGRPPNSIGSRLRERRQQLGLTVRDVQAASEVIARNQGDGAFLIRASRLSEIENHNRAPGLACLYSLSVIFHQSFADLCSCCGLNLGQRTADRKAVRRELEQRLLPKRVRRRQKELERRKKRRILQQRRRERERRNQRIVTWLRRGLTYTEVAGRLAVSKERVRQCVIQTDYGRRLVEKRRRTRQRRNQKILQWLRQGATYEYVARCLGITRQRVHVLAQRAGYSRPKPAPPPSPSN